MLLKMTTNDIVSGKQGCPEGCPVARLLTRELAKKYIVGSLLVYDERKNSWFSIGLELRQWIEIYDNAKDITQISPIDLELEGGILDVSK
jgi:hypothetical protein